MRNKLLRFIREHEMLQPGDACICAVSGGADKGLVPVGFFCPQLVVKMGSSQGKLQFLP